jgi:hypothetical protein
MNDLSRRVDVPEVLESDDELECELEVVVGRPVDGCSHVLLLGKDERQPESLVVVFRQVS